MQAIKTLIAILLENEPGSLSRVIGLFSQRNFNIESLSVAPTSDTSLSRLNITTVQHSRESVEQITKQLNKLIPVYKLAVLTDDDYVGRELALVKMRSATQQDKIEIQFVLNAYRAEIVDMGKTFITAQFVLNPCAIDDCIEALGSRVIEIVRTGAIGVTRKELPL